MCTDVLHRWSNPGSLQMGHTRCDCGRWTLDDAITHQEQIEQECEAAAHQAAAEKRRGVMGPEMCTHYWTQRMRCAAPDGHDTDHQSSADIRIATLTAELEQARSEKDDYWQGAMQAARERDAARRECARLEKEKQIYWEAIRDISVASTNLPSNLQTLVRRAQNAFEDGAALAAATSGQPEGDEQTLTRPDGGDVYAAIVAMENQ